MSWLTEYLQQTGAYNPDGISRLLKLCRCPQCKTPVLQGLDDDRCALAATTDTHDIDTHGEILALRLGLHTYSIRRHATTNRNGWSLNPRYPAAIETGVHGPVVAQHRCGISIPPARRPSLPMPHPTTSDQPPF